MPGTEGNAIPRFKPRFRTGAWSACGRFELPEWFALLLYTALTAWAARVHEAWADEAQAWLIARDNTFLGLLRQVHYEGTPALWHVMLWVEARLGLSFAAMHGICVVLGVAAAFLILKFAPFPRWMKLLLPFGSYLLYHTPVIARSYSLGVFLVLLLVVLVRTTPSRVLAASVVCGLAANTSLYACVASAGFGVLLLTRAARARQHIAAAAATMVFFFGLAIYGTIPAPDAFFGASGALNRVPVLQHAFAVATGIPAPSLTASGVAMPAEVRALVPPERSGAAKVRAKLAYLFFLPLFLVSSSAVLGATLLVVLALWLARERRLWAALPFLLLVVAGALLNMTEHHLLLLWSVLVATLWLAWPQPQEAPSSLAVVVQLLLGIVLVQQVAWSLSALFFEARHTFDSGPELAGYLRQYGHHRSIDTVTFYSVSAQPYFTRSPFANMPTAYWPWAAGKEPGLDIPGVLAHRPDLIVASEVVHGTALIDNVVFRTMDPGTPFYGVPAVRWLESAGYREVRRFCGRQPMHFGYSEQSCTVILQAPATHGAEP